MRARPLATYFVLCFVLTWSLAGLTLFAPSLAERIFGPPGVANPGFYLAVYVPSVVGILLTAWYQGTAGLKALFARLDPRRGGLLWAVVTILLFIAVGDTAGVLSGRFGGTGLNWNLRDAPMILGMSLIFDPGPIGEEFGWRGFALPRLLRRFSPLAAGVILGLIWALWHLPAFFVPELPQSRLSLPVFFLGTTALAIVMTWLALRSNGNLLPAIVAHLMMNHTSDITGVSFGALQAGTIGLALVLIVTGQLKPRPVGPEPATLQRAPAARAA